MADQVAEPTKTELTADPAAASAVDAAPVPDGSTILGGDNAVKPEGGDPTAAEGEKKPDAEKLAGAPEAYELKAPEGMALDADAVSAAEPVFREMGLTNEQAQKLTDLYAAQMTRAGSAANDRVVADVAAVRADWAKAAQTDPDIGGAKLDETKHLAAKAIDGSPASTDFRKFLNDTGLGNHPEMLRIMSFYGARMSEDSFAKGGGSQPLTREEKFYGRRSA